MLKGTVGAAPGNTKKRHTIHISHLTGGPDSIVGREGTAAAGAGLPGGTATENLGCSCRRDRARNTERCLLPIAVHSAIEADEPHSPSSPQPTSLSRILASPALALP